VRCQSELGTAGMAYVHGKWFDCRTGSRFFASPKLPPRSGATQHPIRLEGVDVSPRELSDRSVKLNISLCLVQRFRMSVAECLVAVASWSAHSSVTCNMPVGGRDCCCILRCSEITVSGKRSSDTINILLPSPPQSVTTL
jgi:hypothetical protein